MFVCAGLDRRTGETVIFVVNPYAEAREGTVALSGVGRVAPEGTAIELTSGSPDDENSFESPTKVAPREEAIAVAGPVFQRTFPACSLTVLRLKAEE